MSLHLSCLLSFTNQSTNGVASPGRSNTFAEYPICCLIAVYRCIFWRWVKFPSVLAVLYSGCCRVILYGALKLTGVASCPPSPLFDDLMVQLLFYQHPSSSHTCFDRELNVQDRTVFWKVSIMFLRVVSSPFDSPMALLCVTEMSWLEMAFKNSSGGLSYSQ